MCCSMYLIPGEELRMNPGCLSFEQARLARLSLNMSRALGHVVLTRYGVSPQVFLIHYLFIPHLVQFVYHSHATPTPEQPLLYPPHDYYVKTLAEIHAKCLYDVLL